MAALAVVTVLAALGVLQLELRTDGAALQPANDPVVERTRSDQERFRDPDRLVLLLTSLPSGPDVASPTGLQAVKQLHAEVAALPGVVSRRVRSLATLLDPSPGQTVVEIPNFLDAIPQDAAAMSRWRERLAASPHGHGLFLSPDGRAAALYLPLAPNPSRTASVQALERWLDSHRPGEFDLDLTGPVAAEVELGRVVLNDLARLVPLLVLIIAVLLYACLRSVGALAVAMTEVGMVLVWTLGAMGWAGIPVTLVTTILPIVVLTMSITDEIHLLDRLREHLTPGTPRTSAMSAAISDVGRPIVLTSWTTAAGLLSFTFTSIAPLRHFGLFAAFGVLVAMLLSFTLIPALVVRLPEHWFAAPARGEPAPGAGASGSRFLGAPSALVGAALVVLAVPFIPRLEARDSWVDNLGPNSPLVRATHRFDRAFWGSYRYDVVLHAEELAYFQFPPGLAAVEKMVAHLETAPHVAGVVSHLDAHEIHADVDSLPLPVSALPLETVRRFSGELMKIQGRIDLEHFLSADGRSARIRLLVPDADYATTEALERFIDETVPRMLEGTELTFHTSGPLAAAQASVGAVVGNVMRSTALTFVAIALLLTLALRSAAQALVCLLPLVGAVTILLGGMAWWGIPLGIATGMLTALTAGAGVDFGLHALHAYRASRGSGMPHAQALTATLVRAGRPIAWNATVLASGLLALGVSSVPPNQRLGVLLASAMVLCCVMSALVLPWSLGKLPAPRAEGP